MLDGSLSYNGDEARTSSGKFLILGACFAALNYGSYYYLQRAYALYQQIAHIPWIYVLIALAFLALAWIILPVLFLRSGSSARIDRLQADQTISTSSTHAPHHSYEPSAHHTFEPSSYTPDDNRFRRGLGDLKADPKSQEQKYRPAPSTTFRSRSRSQEKTSSPPSNRELTSLSGVIKQSTSVFNQGNRTESLNRWKSNPNAEKLQQLLGQLQTKRELSPEQVKSWAASCHWAALMALVFPYIGNLLGPFLVWRSGKSSSPEIDYHGRESLNFQISLTAYQIVLFVLAGAKLIAFAIFILIVFGLTNIIKAGKAAKRGEKFRYPLTLRFIRGPQLQ